MEGMHCNVGNIGTVYTVRWLFAQPKCSRSMLFLLEHGILYPHRSTRASCICYARNLTKSAEAYPTEKKMAKDVAHLTLPETWNDNYRCKQMYHCITVTLKVGILLKVKQSPDDVDNSSYYWLHSVKSQLLYVHLKLELKAFTVYHSVLLARSKQSKDKILTTSNLWHFVMWTLVTVNLTIYNSNMSKYHVNSGPCTTKTCHLNIVQSQHWPCV